jgi:hypothetical protein
MLFDGCTLENGPIYFSNSARDGTLRERERSGAKTT